MRSLWFPSSVLSSLGNCARHLSWLSSLVLGPCSPFGLLVLTGQIHFLFTGPHILLKHRWRGSKQRRFLTCVPPEYTREEGISPLAGCMAWISIRRDRWTWEGCMGIYPFRLCTVWEDQRNKGTYVYAQDWYRVDSWAEGWSMETWPSGNPITRFRDLLYKRQDLDRWRSNSWQSPDYRHKGHLHWRCCILSFRTTREREEVSRGITS